MAAAFTLSPLAGNPQRSTEDGSFVVLIAGTVAVVGIVSGVVAFALARRWPTPTEAPAVSASTVVDEVDRHPGLASFLRRRIDPAALTGLGMSVAAVAAVSAVVGMGLLFAMARTNRGLARWDSSFARFGAEHASDASTSFLKAVTWFGGTSGAIACGLIAAVVALAHDRRHGRSIVAFCAVVIAGQFALSNMVKVLVDRARPDLRPLTGFSGTSFPSGHATAAAATLLAVALVLGRRRSPTARAAIWAVAISLASMVAATRVLLGVHWFTDVLAGLLLGWGWFALCSIAFGGRVLRFGAPVELAEVVSESEPLAGARAR